MLIVTIIIIITISTGYATPRPAKSTWQCRKTRQTRGLLFSPVKAQQGRYETFIQCAAWLILISAVVATVWARIRLADLPLERDEGEYALAGQLILRGIAPYKLAYTMKFPGIGAAYALLMSIFGHSATGIHIGLVAANLISAALIFFLGRSVLGKVPGLVTASAFLVLSLMPHVLGTAAHATHFVVLFALAGTLLLIRATDRQSGAAILGSGFLFGIATLMKQPGLFFVLFGAVYLFVRDYQAALKPSAITRRNILFLVSAAMPFAISCAVLWNAGVFQQFWFWTISYAAKYGSQVGVSEGMHVLAGHFFGVVGTAWPVWVVAMIGLAVSIVTAGRRGIPLFLIMFTFFSALAVCPGFYFRPHYFILLLPAISLLAGMTIAAACREAHKFCLVALMLFAISIAWPVFAESDFFFQRSLPETNRLINGTNPFPEARKIGEYIRANSHPDETIAVLGSEPEIYFYAERRPATGYIYTYGLMEPQSYAHQMQLEMINEIETARPKFLVLVVISKSWLAGRDSDLTIFRWTDSYCDANYEEVGLINISDEGTDYYLSGKPPNAKPAAEHILIYRRKL